MKPLKWYPFDPAKGYRQKRPPIYKFVLLAFPPDAFGEGNPSATAIGYRKDSGGDKRCPFFVTPGIGGVPTHWCDCLPDDFAEQFGNNPHPYWQYPKRTP